MQTNLVTINMEPWLYDLRSNPGAHVNMGDGSCVDDGIYIMLREIVDNAIDEFLIGYANRVEISIDYATGETSVRDNGRGVPRGKIRVAFGSEWVGGGMFDSNEFAFKPRGKEPHWRERS